MKARSSNTYTHRLRTHTHTEREGGGESAVIGRTTTAVRSAPVRVLLSLSVNTVNTYILYHTMRTAVAPAIRKRQDSRHMYQSQNKAHKRIHACTERDKTAIYVSQMRHVDVHTGSETLSLIQTCPGKTRKKRKRRKDSKHTHTHTYTLGCTLPGLYSMVSHKIPPPPSPMDRSVVSAPFFCILYTTMEGANIPLDRYIHGKRKAKISMNYLRRQPCGHQSISTLLVVEKPSMVASMMKQRNSVQGG